MHLFSRSIMKAMEMIRQNELNIILDNNARPRLGNFTFNKEDDGKDPAKGTYYYTKDKNVRPRLEISLSIKKTMEMME